MHKRTDTPLRIGIVGAGTAGLAMARALTYLDTGAREVTVIDRSDSLRPNMGGGIQINGGAAILAKMGLGAEVKAAGLPVNGIRSRTVAGREVLYIDTQAEVSKEPSLMHEGDPMIFTIMRDSLQRVLADSIKEDVNLELNKRLTSLDERKDTVLCKFDDGTEAEFDLLIGADGIRSEVKKQIWGGSQGIDPVYSNIRTQFGVAEGWERPGVDGEMHQWFGEGTYVLTGQYRGIDNKPFEMIAVVFADPKAVSENPNWNTGEVKSGCMERLKATAHPKEVMDLADRCERFYELGVHYNPALSPWISPKGRVVLIGDAAHAIPPFLGQGANQAIQDAYCLAMRIRDIKDGSASLQDALTSYESTRKLPTAVLQLESRFLGLLETSGGKHGTLPAFVRDNFFAATGVLGVAKTVFMTGATPRV